jgi:hypothetical protein
MNGEGVSGAFEELPALFVVLVGISLFAVTVAHAYSSQAGEQDFTALQEDCLAFSRMVRSSDLLCNGEAAGNLDLTVLKNLSGDCVLEEFDPLALGFEYSLAVSRLDTTTGGIAPVFNFSSVVVENALQTASFASPVNLNEFGSVGAGVLTVSVWRSE